MVAAPIGTATCRNHIGKGIDNTTVESDVID